MVSHQCFFETVSLQLGTSFTIQREYMHLLSYIYCKWK